MGSPTMRRLRERMGSEATVTIITVLIEEVDDTKTTKILQDTNVDATATRPITKVTDAHANIIDQVDIVDAHTRHLLRCLHPTQGRDLAALVRGEDAMTALARTDATTINESADATTFDLDPARLCAHLCVHVTRRGEMTADARIPAHDAQDPRAPATAPVSH